MSVSACRFPKINARISRWFGAVCCATVVACGLILHRAHAQNAEMKFTQPLATGVRLDPAGEVIDVGNLPLGMALAPDGQRAALVLSGWREQGLQIVDLRTRQVTQTLPQEAAFLGVAFSHDGKELYGSGGNEDAIFCYSWEHDAAKLDRKIALAQKAKGKPATRYPAGLAVSRAGDYLYVAENVGDSLAVADLATGKIAQRLPTGHYPYAVEAAANGKVYVSAWAEDTIGEFRTDSSGRLNPAGKLKVGPRPSALVSNRSGSRLYAALAGVDQIAVVDTQQDKVIRRLNDAPPAGPSEGSTPNALALSQDESKLFVAEADNNSVAVFDVTESAAVSPKTQPLGRIPVDWYPTALAANDGQLIVVNGKGHGSRANPDGPIPGEGIKRPLGYDLGQLNGTLRLIPEKDSLPPALREYSLRTAQANNWNTRRTTKKYPPFKHVVYIIKENRTYDQVLGDLKEGDGDSSLVFFGKDVAPNHRALALRFGLFDRFFTNAEVSSQGHIWSTAAYVTDFGEKTIPSGYSDRREGIDGEEIDEPLNGFLWTLARKKRISFRDYGEMMKAREGWPVTQRELAPDISSTYPPFDLKIPDQKRADAWIAELQKFVSDGKMPQLEVMHLPSDHTAGGRAGYPTPRAYMADNDLALGRIVEALSKTPFWKDTVIFVLEDDSQAGPDHVDSHRSPFYVISAYNPPGTIHRFVNTTDVVAAIEDILGLERLSKYDYFSQSLADVFVETADLTPWKALIPEQDRNELNPPATAAAKMSEELDFSAPDRINDAVFNQILWKLVKGDEPLHHTDGKAALHLFELSR